jgi:hypothetical protein
VDDRGNVWIGAAIGAVAGAVVGYLFFTARGSRARHAIVARAAEAADHLGQVQGLGATLREVSADGWAALARLTEPPRAAPPQRPAAPDLSSDPRLQ